MKNHPLGTLLILGVLACPPSALAGQTVPNDGGDSARAPGDGVAERRELTPEQCETMARIFDMHGERLHRLSEDVWAETTELRALAAARGIDKNDIEERIARIGELRAQLIQERRAVRAELAAGGITDFPSHRRRPRPGHVRSVSRPS